MIFKKKTVERSLQRDNQKLEKQFNELLRIFFDENHSLNKIIPSSRIPYLKKIFLNLLYWNGIDVLIDHFSINKEKNRKIFYISTIFCYLVVEYITLYENYYHKNITFKYDGEELFFNFLDNNIASLFKWLLEKTPFSKFSNFLEIYETEDKTIYDWKKGNHIMTVETINKIRNSLENIAFQEKIQNTQNYIDFFIFQLYLESCKLRLKKEFIKYSNIDKKTLDSTISFIKSLISVVKSNPDLALQINKIQDIYINTSLYILSKNINLYKDFINDFNTEENIVSFLQSLPDCIQKHLQFRIKDNSFQKKSIGFAEKISKDADKYKNLITCFYIDFSIEIRKNKEIKYHLDKITEILLPLFNQHIS